MDSARTPAPPATNGNGNGNSDSNGNSNGNGNGNINSNGNSNGNSNRIESAEGVDFIMMDPPPRESSERLQPERNENEGKPGVNGGPVGGAPSGST